MRSEPCIPRTRCSIRCSAARGTSRSSSRSPFKLRRKAERARSPQLVFFDDREKAIKYATFLAQAKTPPLDLTYYSPAKFEAINRSMDRGHFPARPMA